MAPARWFFAKRESEPTTEVAIRRALTEDLYVVLADYNAAGQTATYTVTINPLVNWIWFGFGIMALGTIIALLPETAYAFAVAKVPAGAAGATTSLLILSLLVPGAAHAQHVDSSPDAPNITVARTPLEKELWGEIICMCGGCGRKKIGDFCCAKAASMRTEIAKLLDAGKTREEVYQYFIAQYGSQEPLGAPIDKGFNRLAWLFPYLVGASGAVAVAFLAMRWSKRAPEPSAAAGTPTEDPALRARLDDELRELD
jgi:cytochrome c-type biogenesis protein CcmF